MTFVHSVFTGFFLLDFQRAAKYIKLALAAPFPGEEHRLPPSYLANNGLSPLSARWAPAPVSSRGLTFRSRGAGSRCFLFRLGRWGGVGALCRLDSLPKPNLFFC